MTETLIVDTDLGEVLQENEEEIAREIADAIAARIQQGQRPALRDAHAKAHGCVEAMFRVEDDLPPQLAQGVFVPGKSYQAWIRFSNGASDATQPDAKGDARGMAIKLLNVPGEKILSNERETQTQDFIMINHPVFFVEDPSRYRALIDSTGSSDLLAKFDQLLAIGFKGGIIAQEIISSKIGSPLETRYWSMVPYRLGDPPHKQAIKFSARPQLPARTAIPDNPAPNFLRETMIQQLAAGSAGFDFEVQPRTSPDMSVEDSMIEWKEADAPFFKLATITIPQQLFATPERDQFCENLSFAPWHALPQHRPLGAINRARRVIYETISELRHTLNRTQLEEPQGVAPESALLVGHESGAALRRARAGNGRVGLARRSDGWFPRSTRAASSSAGPRTARDPECARTKSRERSVLPHKLGEYKFKIELDLRLWAAARSSAGRSRARWARTDQAWP